MNALRCRHFGLTLLLLTLPAPGSAAPRNAREAPTDLPPVLVSTEGGGPAWSTVAELADAAKDGHADAAFQYAQLLEEGDQVPPDAEQALAFYRQSAKAGHGDALFRLGKIHHDGLLGVPADRARAFELYRQAARAGIPEGMYNIGAMLVSGRGVKRDYIEGLAWLILAADRGADATSGVEQVKQRLARWPDRIAAAERRATTLEKELAEDAAQPREKTAPAEDAARAPPAPTPPGLIPPRPPPVTIERPKIAVPPPPPSPQLDR